VTVARAGSAHESHRHAGGSGREAAGFAPLESATERVIVPAKRRISLRDVAREGAVIRVLAGRDFKVKYRRSSSGLYG
jgi:hypothetical protein